MKIPEITWTCTLSKRLSLFKTMMLSFFYNCQDIKLISEFLLADDHSEKADIALIRHEFPKVKILNNEKGGQLNSIKLLLENVKTDWIFHTEDDWKFIKEDHYIKKAFEIIETDKRIKNVVFRFWECMYIKDDDIEYRMHVYNPMDYKKDWDIIKLNDCTYGGLSLNPGIIHVPTLKKCIENITQVDIKDRTWDRKMSENYWNMGLKRANLKENYVEHTGVECSCYSKVGN